MTRRYGLQDDQWARIEALLPGRRGHVGGTARDKRLFVDAVWYRYRAGILWRDLPERYGGWKNAHRRFSRWAASGVWERPFQALRSDADNEYAMIGARWRYPCYGARLPAQAAGASRMELRATTCQRPSRCTHTSVIRNVPLRVWPPTNASCRMYASVAATVPSP